MGWPCRCFSLLLGAVDDSVFADYNLVDIFFLEIHIDWIDDFWRCDLLNVFFAIVLEVALPAYSSRNGTSGKSRDGRVAELSAASVSLVAKMVRDRDPQFDHCIAVDLYDCVPFCAYSSCSIFRFLLTL